MRPVSLSAFLLFVFLSALLSVQAQTDSPASGRDPLRQGPPGCAFCGGTYPGRTLIAPDSPERDPRGGFRRMVDRHTSTRAYRMAFIGVPLVVGGVVMQSYDSDFRRLRNGYGRSFHQTYDDYLQYAPACLMVGLKACGVKSRISWGRMVTSDAFSVALVSIAVNSLKSSCRVMRPDGSSRNSFPSGHTATAFMTATMLHKEYGYRSPWYSIGGYTAATATGVTRQLNNRHWMSDVMVGAGIGILATELGYFLSDLIFKNRGLNVYEMTAVYDRYRHPSFFGFCLGLTTVPGAYTPRPGLRTTFFSGPTVGVQGAWFASPYWGVGGRFSVTNLRVSVNGISQTDDLECASLYAGPYFSYPFSMRWLVGAKLLGGVEHSKSCRTDRYELGRCTGASFGTGVSATYIVTQNLGVHFSTDYDCAPPLVRGSRARLHKLTLGMTVCAVF